MTVEEDDPLLSQVAVQRPVSRKSYKRKEIEDEDELLSGPASVARLSRPSHANRRSFPSLHTLESEPFSSSKQATTVTTKKTESSGKKALESTPPELIHDDRECESDDHEPELATVTTPLCEPTQEDSSSFIFNVPALKSAIATLDQHHGSYDAHHIESIHRLFKEKFTPHVYSQWYLQLLSGYHLIFYGYGAKETAIARWLGWTRMTAKYRVLVLDGCNESLNLELVCHRLAKTIGFMPSTKRKSDRVEELLEAMEKEKMVEGWKPWLFVVHHLDGPLTRSDAFQSFFHALAQKKDLVSFVCTMEHIHACLLFSPNYFPPDRSQTLFVDCTTMTRYSASCLQTALQVAGVGGLGAARGSALGSISASAAITVLSNLTSHARKVYALLANWQLSWERDESEPSMPSHHFGTPIKNAVPSLALLVASPAVASSLSASSLLSPKSPATAAYMAGPHAQTMVDPSIGLTFEQFYQMARENFLATHESTFRALLNEFTDHALIVVRRSTPPAASTATLSSASASTSAVAATAHEPPTERLASPLPYTALRSVLTALEQLQ